MLLAPSGKDPDALAPEPVLLCPELCPLELLPPLEPNRAALLLLWDERLPLR